MHTSAVLVVLGINPTRTRTHDVFEHQTAESRTQHTEEHVARPSSSHTVYVRTYVSTQHRDSIQYCTWVPISSRRSLVRLAYHYATSPVASLLSSQSRVESGVWLLRSGPGAAIRALALGRVGRRTREGGATAAQARDPSSELRTLRFRSVGP